ncbi:hypothetical protein SESBI_14701 [Sesbania bispinosa]|nr:hypothetical protein SESBI_14701 [Sesbania bispinosa]
MALSSQSLLSALNTTDSVPKVHHFHSPPSSSHFPVRSPIYHTSHALSISEKWRAKVSFFPAFLKKAKMLRPSRKNFLRPLHRLIEGLMPLRRPTKS